jgi:hypothetical protein
VLDRVASTPRPTPSTPTTTAPQPARRAPRLAAKTPANAAQIPSSAGQTGERAVIGGIAARNATTPSPNPYAATAFGRTKRAASS